MIRRQAKVLTSVVLTLALLTGCGAKDGAKTAAPAQAPTGNSKPFAGQTLRVATWGSSFGTYVKAAIGDPLEAETGAKVEYIQGNPRNHLTQLVAARGQEPPFDVVLLDDAVQEQAIRDGFTEKLDFSKIPAIKELFPEAITAEGQGPAFYLTSIGLVYNTKKYEELGLKPPQTIADLFDPKLKGRVAVPDMNVAMGPFALIAASYNAGGDDKNLEPGIKKLAELNPYVYKDSSDLATRMANGDIWAGWWIDGQTRATAAAGAPLKFVRPKVNDQYDGMSNFGTVNIVKGTKVRDLAQAFLVKAISKEAQLKMGTDLGYNPVHVAAAAELVKNPKYASEYVADPKAVAKLYRMNNNRLNIEFPKWLDLWNRTIRK